MHPVMSIICKHTLSCRRPQVYGWPAKAGKAAGRGMAGTNNARRPGAVATETAHGEWRGGTGQPAGRMSDKKSAPRIRRGALDVAVRLPAV